MIDSPNDPWYKKLGLLFLEVLIFGVIVAVIGGVVFGALAAFGVKLGGEEMDKPIQSLFINFLPQLIMISIAMYVCNTLIFKRPLYVTGFVKKGWLTDTSDGYILAFLLVGVGYLILRFSGHLSSEGIEFEPYYFFGFFAMFVIQSAGEEVLARSWLMPAIESRFGAWAALLISSSLFGLMHAGNPNVSWVGISNVFLAGMMLGMFFLKYRNIWFITGLHAGWNWIQASVFDFNVSGFDVDSLINFNPYGNELISGGQFGFEGSIVSCILLLGVIGYLLFKHYNDMFGNRPAYYVENAAVDGDQSIDENSKF